MRTDRISRQEAEDLVRHSLEEGEVIPGRHFREELAEQSLVFEDAWVVLRTGHVYNEAEPDPKMGEWKYQIEGYEPGGRWLVIVLDLKTVDRTSLVTVFSVGSRRKT